MHAKELDLLSEAMVIVRSWIGTTFRDRLLARSVTTLYLSVNVTTEIEVRKLFIFVVQIVTLIFLFSCVVL
jgi:hypothetical protein